MKVELKPGDSVYVVDETHAWEAVFGRYESAETALVIDQGGQAVTVSVKALKPVKKRSSRSGRARSGT